MEDGVAWGKQKLRNGRRTTAELQCMDQKCFGNGQTCTVLAIKLHRKTNEKTDHIMCLLQLKQVKISHLFWIHQISKQHAH